MAKSPRRTAVWPDRDAYLRSALLKDKPKRGEFPFTLAAVNRLGTLRLHPKVTFLVGENGSGKSTLLEGIADIAGFPQRGGSKHFATLSEGGWSDLGPHLQLVRNAVRERDSFFLRAESFFDVSDQIEELAKGPGGTLEPYGGKSPHLRSHGEAFMMLMTTRFVGRGLYILDEPEAALSPTRQLAFLVALHDLVARRSSQFLIATHSPILMSYPGAFIYLLNEQGIKRVRYEDTEHYQLFRDFLNDRQTYLNYLFEDPGVDPGKAGE
jgi:predicted ATPase